MTDWLWIVVIGVPLLLLIGTILKALGETAIDLLQSIFRHKDEPDWRDRDPD
jgi:hypothetical protein